GMVTSMVPRPRWLSRRWLAGAIAVAAILAAGSAGLQARVTLSEDPSVQPEPPGPQTLADWAAEVNRVCSEHAAETAEPTVQIRRAGADVVAISQAHVRAGTSDTDQYFADLEAPARAMFDASTIIDASYNTTLRRLNGIALPEDPQQRAYATAWLERYDELVDSFAKVYEASSLMVAAGDPSLKTFYMAQMTFRLDNYNELAPEVREEGSRVGVESCVV
ncbi:MAG TPA: hypothetical protein VIL37_10925, partial [Natronosporangium sp.]